MDDDVLYSHSVMALHNPKYMTDLLGRYDCVVWRQQGNPAMSLSVIAITRAGLETVIDFAETQYVVDETISQEANVHNLLLQALGQRCVMLQDKQTISWRVLTVSGVELLELMLAVGRRWSCCTAHDWTFMMSWECLWTI